jgi:hypothetical protein
MLVFDQAHLYQFSLFLEDQQQWPSPETVEKLAGLLSRSTSEAGSTLRIKLGQPEIGQAMVLQAGGNASQQPVVSWRAGSGVWRVTWTPARLDVHFDARGYGEVTDQKIDLHQIRVRLTPNLAEVSTVLGQAVNRLAVIVTGQATTTEGSTRPSRFIAATFFREELEQQERRGELFDAIGRTNRVTNWELEPALKVRVNRNETGTANSVIRNGTEETNLTWQWDVNTSALETSKSFSPQAISAFFQQAESWIDERAKALQSIR